MIVNDAIEALVHLSQLTKQVNAALEMMPASNLRNDLMRRRQLIRDFENSYVWPNQNTLTSGLFPGLLEDVARKTLDSCESAIQTETNILLIAKKNPSGMSGLFDIFSSSSSSDNLSANDPSDVPNGTQALQYYFNYSTQYPNFPYTDFQTMLNDLTAQSPELISTIGFTIRTADISDSQVQTAMQNVADHGQGNLPANLSVFFNALGKAASNPGFWDAIPFVAAQSFSQIASGVATGLQNVGTGVLGTLSLASTAAKYLPIILIGAGGLWLYINYSAIKKRVSL